MVSRDNPSANLGRNIRSLREAPGLSQQQLAKLSGVPRATWANLESGSANPTLTVLVKVAAALQVSIEELIGPPRAVARFYPGSSLRSRKRTGVEVRDILPDVISGLQIERMELPAGAGMRGIPHTPGTREYLTCERGQVSSPRRASPGPWRPATSWSSGGISTTAMRTRATERRWRTA